MVFPQNQTLVPVGGGDAASAFSVMSEPVWWNLGESIFRDRRHLLHDVTEDMRPLGNRTKETGALDSGLGPEGDRV